MPAGNRIPLFGPKMGCRFPLDPLRETASHFKGVNRDVISPNGTFGKPGTSDVFPDHVPALCRMAPLLAILPNGLPS